MSTAQDRVWMRRALALAEQGRGRTRPNPMVGCVLVRDEALVAEGWHERAGGPHAEARALEGLGEEAAGATAYVTLEPCAHHGRTPPCADALIQAGIRRVVVATLDPDARVSGRGVRILRDAGVTVEVGCCEEEARGQNLSYMVRQILGRATVSLKAAASLDGKLATHTGASQWITGAPARAEVHRRRGQVQAVGFGSGTILADDPQGTARPLAEGASQPTRVVFDTRLRSPASARVFDTSEADTIVLCGPDASLTPKARGLRETGVTVQPVPLAADGHLELGAALRLLLEEHGLSEVQVEGGPTLHAALVDADLVDSFELYLAPMLLGGQDAPALGRGRGHARLDSAPRFRFMPPRMFGEDVLLEGVRLPAWQGFDEEVACLQD